MKKFAISIILSIFMFAVCYPAIYATEELITNETKEEITEQSENEGMEEESQAKPEENEIEISPETEEPTPEISNETEPIQRMNLAVPETPTKDVTINESTKPVTKNYKGDMYIDTPTNNQTYELSTNGSVKVTGWAASDDANARMVFYINNKIMIGKMTRTSRMDIDKVISYKYGGTKNTPLAGFEANVDISKYKPGTYEFKVDQIGSNGQVINSMSRNIEIKAKNYKGEMYIDTPTNNKTCELSTNGSVKVTGWAASDDVNARMVFYINNKIIIGKMTRTSRMDIDKVISYKYGGTKNTPLAGFEANVDISKYKPGKYEFKVDQIGSNGQVINSMSRNIEIKAKNYKGEMYIDTPTNNKTYELPTNGSVKVTGWAASDDSGARMVFYINNKIIIGKMTRTSRMDIDKVISYKYGGTKNTPLAGFEANIDISKYKPGTYEFKVDQIGSNGQVINSMSRNIEIKAKNYKGDMYMDTPTYNTTFKIPQTATIKIKGWAVSEDSQAQITLSVDDKYCPYTVKRTSRQDIDKAVSYKYGGTANTPLSGVEIDLQSTMLSEGRHKIIVMQVSRFGEIMAHSEIIINSSTPSYPSNMCVDAPSNNRRYPSTALEVKGWALSEDPNTYICTYINGVYQTTCGKVSRDDLFAVFGNQYGGKKTNKNAGFYSLINTSNLPEGRYTLKVVQYSGYGKVLGYREVPFMISNTKTWGIDVSHHNGTIDWNAVKNSGVDFAILKIGEYYESSGTTLVDSQFETNYAACKARGIAVGGYFYSYAFNPTEAAHEADACTRIISGKSFEMPIFIDIEDKIVTNAVNRRETSVENLTNAMITFCDIMNSRGYQSGVYSYKNFFEIYLNTPVLERYNIWLAHYVNETNYNGKYDMWQYTSDGRVSGINGNDGRVDLNWCFKRYP